MFESYVLRHSGARPQAEHPESITTIGGYGFRVRDFVAPRKDTHDYISDLT
jgi:hypothetical protein